MRNFFPGIGAIAGLILGCAVSLEAIERTPPNILATAQTFASTSADRYPGDRQRPAGPGHKNQIIVSVRLGDTTGEHRVVNFTGPANKCLSPFSRVITTRVRPKRGTVNFYRNIWLSVYDLSI